MKLLKKNILLAFFLGLSGLTFSQIKFEQYGFATYYSDAFQGRNTSSGEIYDKTIFSAAHASLPFQTI